MSTEPNRPESEELSQQWQHLEETNPRLFPSEIAERLDVSEAELLASRIGERVTLLKADWDALLGQLNTLGVVRTITRNRSAVIEKVGAYPKYEPFQGHALFLGESIDLRLSLEQWAFVFALEKPPRQLGGDITRSIQIFDRYGDAVHKMFLVPVSMVEAYERLVHELSAPIVGTEIDVEVMPLHPCDRRLDREEQERFLAEWSKLEDTHDFFGLLGRFEIDRLAAFRAAEGRFTRRTSNQAVETLLRSAAASSLPLMIFVGNRGCVQIHKGGLPEVLARGDWLSAMRAGSEFHLKPGDIVSSWIVEKPTRDGALLSLEIFDGLGNDIAVFFGVRSEGAGQSDEWLGLLAALHNQEEK